MPRPLGSPNKDKPFRDALRMEALALAGGEVIKHPKGSLRWNAQHLLMNSDVAAIKEIADRLDGKVAQTNLIAGDEEYGPVQFATDEQRLQAVTALLQKANGHDTVE